MREDTFFLYPIIAINAPNEAEATDRVLAAIFEAGVGEIPGWLPEPPSFEEKRFQRAAPDLLAALQRAVEAVHQHNDGGSLDYDWIGEAETAIAKATSPQAR